MARDYRKSSNIIYNPVEAGRERHSSGRDYRQAVAEIGSRDYRTALANEVQNQLTDSQGQATQQPMTLPDFMHPANAINSFNQQQPAPSVQPDYLKPQPAPLDVAANLQPFRPAPTPQPGFIESTLGKIGAAEQAITNKLGLTGKDSFIPEDKRKGAVDVLKQDLAAAKDIYGNKLGGKYLAKGVEDVVQATQAPQQAIYAGVKSVQTGAPYFKTLGDAVTGKKEISASELLQNEGVPKGLAGPVGFGVDVLADPVNFITGFGAKAAAEKSGLMPKLFSFINKNRAVAPELETATRDALTSPTRKMGVATGPLRNASNEQYINKVMSDIKPIVTERMTPPLENPNALAKWLQPHLDASLNQIRKLDYGDMVELANDVKNNMSMYDVARTVAKEKGYNLDQILNNQTPSIKGAADRLRMGRVAGAIEPPTNDVRVAVSTGPRLEPVKPAVNAPTTPISESQLKGSLAYKANKEVASAPSAASLQPVKSVSPKVTPQTDELGFVSTVRNSPNTPPNLLRGLEEKTLTGARTTDVLNRQQAAQLIEKHGADGLTARILAKKGKLSPAEITAAQVLARHYSENGQLDKAIEVISKTATEGREMGQAIQALSQWNKLDQEGALLLATRQLNRGVKDAEDMAKLTPEQALPVQKAAQKIEQVSMAQNLADEVVKMLANKPKGSTLTNEEKSLVRQFEAQVKQVNEQVKPLLKQAKNERQAVINEVAKIAPKDRTRDQVVNFLDAKAAQAAERLKQSRNVGFAAVNKGNPVVDIAIIGAAKLAKNAVKYADFAEEMIRDFGDSVKPYLKEAYIRASNTFRRENGLPSISELSRVVNTAVKNNELDEETAKNLRVMATEIGYYLDDNLKKEAVQDLQMVMKSLGSSTLGDKISTLQTAGQLLSLPTFERNAIGNIAQIGLEKINKMAAVPIDWTISKLTGERTIKFFPQNQEKFWRNFASGTEAGWKGVSPTGTLSSYDVHPNVFGDKNPLRYLTKTLGASLQGMDYAAYRAAYGDTVATYAEHLGKAQGLSKAQIKEQMPQLIKQLDSRIHEIADQAGLYATYQDDTMLSKAAQGIKRGLNAITDKPIKAAVEKGLLPNKLSTEGFGLGDIVLKYAKTPANLVMRGIDYSPIGFIRGIYEIAPLVLNRAKFDQHAATRALSRAITGTVGLTGLGYALADAGILTGAASPDKDMRSLQEQTGQGAYKVNWSGLYRYLANGFDKNAAKYQDGDKLMPYAWLQPAAISLGMGVNANQMLKNQKPGEEKAGYELAWDSLIGGLRTVLENPMVTGLSNVVGATTDLIQKQDASGFGRILKGVPASFIPSVAGQARNATDNQQRETFDSNLLKEMLNIVKNKVPGLSKTLPVSYDTLGKPRERIQGGQANTLGQYLNAFVNPSQLTTYHVTPEAKTVLDVLNESNDPTILPRVGQKYIMVDDPITKKQKRVDLTAEQFSRLQKSMGEQVAEQLRRFTPYLSAEGRKPEQKAAKIKDILTKVGQRARNEIRVEMGFKKKREG